MTPLSSITEAAASIAANYSLGQVRSVERLSGGTTQANYLLRASSGSFIVRSYLTRNTEYVSFEIDALKQLNAAHFECQRPIADLGGQFIGQHDGKPLAVFPYLEGEHDHGEGNHVQVASAIARMHLLSQSMQFVSSDSRHRYDQESCLRTAELNLANHDEDLRARTTFKWLRGEVESLEVPKELPVGLCHCDLNPSNFLYKNGVLVAVLDFDMAARTYLLYDVANLLYWWANPAVDGEHWQERAKEALLAYQKLRPLTRQEQSHLYDMLKLVFLMSMAWFIHLPNETASDRKGVDALNAWGAPMFREQLFGSPLGAHNAVAGS